MEQGDFKAELAALLLEEHSRTRTEQVASLIGGDADRFAMAWEIFCNGSPPLPQRMAWVIAVVTDAHPSLAARYAASIAARIPFMVHPAELRAATRLLARIPLPKESLADLLASMFPLLEDPQVPTAIRVHAMQILYHISNLEPDLKRELALVIEVQAREATAGFKSRARKLLPKLRAEIHKMEQT